ncbi:hypothetical protein vB_RpoS-V16_28 [Ruegeria phage vB_RpoS-V16]|uniref:hypothetical protein n=1 Tax=Ruegeria phage vB_RpoS-V16 TaxID=2218618 RepID=UPI000DCACECE|nr:hypothetical protein JT311_gp28 [Ruegeria phage vB_RpoS-V16]AWY09464.1 hypothetical protein vB_RpoS-V16_28 [Ruegeria phage vB_RpoS-V16]
MRTRVNVGRVILPLHGKSKAPAQRLAHWMAMQEMAGFNHLGHPRGFRIAPTSRKNRRFHQNAPTTPVEALAKLAINGGALA